MFIQNFCSMLFISLFVIFFVSISLTGLSSVSQFSPIVILNFHGFQVSSFFHVEQILSSSNCEKHLICNTFSFVSISTKLVHSIYTRFILVKIIFSLIFFLLSFSVCLSICISHSLRHLFPFLSKIISHQLVAQFLYSAMDI